MNHRELMFAFHETASGDDGDDIVNCSLKLTGENTEYLPFIMDRLQELLQSAGFDYLKFVNLGEGQYGYTGTFH